MSLAPKLEKIKIQKAQSSCVSLRMYSRSNDLQDLNLDDDDGLLYPSESASSCCEGHRSCFNIQTHQGGSICLHCFSNLVSNPLSPTIHVSYALSNLSRSLSHPPFLRSILTFHPHFLLSPLVTALSSFDDEPIAEQIVDLILLLSASADDDSVCREFVARVSDRISSGALAWTSRQLHMVSMYIKLNVLLFHIHSFIVHIVS